jgi:hypothetical protein
MFKSIIDKLKNCNISHFIAKLAPPESHNRVGIKESLTLCPGSTIKEFNCT